MTAMSRRRPTGGIRGSVASENGGGATEDAEVPTIALLLERVTAWARQRPDVRGLAVVPPRWASTEPVDAGTRKVVTDGMRILYDPDGRLSALAVACQVDATG
jgi:hypothetical protein